MCMPFEMLGHTSLPHPDPHITSLQPRALHPERQTLNPGSPDTHTTDLHRWFQRLHECSNPGYEPATPTGTKMASKESGSEIWKEGARKGGGMSARQEGECEGGIPKRMSKML